jgi:hypothetical protein
LEQGNRLIKEKKALLAGADDLKNDVSSEQTTQHRKPEKTGKPNFIGNIVDVKSETHFWKKLCLELETWKKVLVWIKRQQTNKAGKEQVFPTKRV